jgi:hypothetical protein
MVRRRVTSTMKEQSCEDQMWRLRQAAGVGRDD